MICSIPPLLSLGIFNILEIKIFTQSFKTWIEIERNLNTPVRIRSFQIDLVLSHPRPPSETIQLNQTGEEFLIQLGLRSGKIASLVAVRHRSSNSPCTGHHLPTEFNRTQICYWHLQTFAVEIKSFRKNLNCIIYLSHATGKRVAELVSMMLGYSYLYNKRHKS